MRLDELLNDEERKFMINFTSKKCDLNYLNEIRKMDTKELFIPEVKSITNGDIMFRIIFKMKRFCECLKMSKENISTVLSIMIVTHIYFLTKSWQALKDIYLRFEDLIMKHGMMEDLNAAEPWDPINCYKILIFFKKMYCFNLPLIELFVNTQKQVNIKLDNLE